MAQNVYVIEFNVDENNSLLAVKEELTPIFARNRWLHARGYLPPTIANYWQKAASKWVDYLFEEPQVLETKGASELFKRCVREMGIEGLKAVLNTLKGKDRPQIEALYGKIRPAFYAVCANNTPAQEVGAYYNLLLHHIGNGDYFPYSELGFSFERQHQALLINLISRLNGVVRAKIVNDDPTNPLAQLEKISIADCLEDTTGCNAFLHELVRKATDEGWLGLIVIPELDDKSNTSDTLRDLRLLYADLNNVILGNRRGLAAQRTIDHLDEISPSNITPGGVAVAAACPRVPAAVLPANLFPDVHGEWFLNKGGQAAVELQQQMEVENVLQLDREHQEDNDPSVDEGISGKLVNYDNLYEDDVLFKAFVDAYKTENRLLTADTTPFRKAFDDFSNDYKHTNPHASDDECLLNFLFKTWISANPQNHARYVIKHMTLDAAKALMRKHLALPSGLNPDNLPKGFYTARTKDGELYLGYRVERGYFTTQTKLTVNLGANPLPLDAWAGDFRQLNAPKYAGRSIVNFDQDDWNTIFLFTQLQPQKLNYTTEFNKFCAQRSGESTIFPHLTPANRAKIITAWPVAFQVWQCAGVEGIRQFLSHHQDHLDPRPACELLLKDLGDPALHNWAMNMLVDSSGALKHDDAYLRALGQVYYRYDAQGLRGLLRKLRYIEANLGEAFFDAFNHLVLAKSHNFNEFMSVEFFTAMDDMVAQLKPAAETEVLQTKSDNHKRLWIAASGRHMDMLGWDEVDHLWQGFSYFLKQMERLGVALKGDAFDGIPPMDMLTTMDRILRNLRKIPSEALKERYLIQLRQGKLDLTHGGIYGAVEYDGIKSVDEDLFLTGFNYTSVDSPTYAPDLKTLFSWDAVNAAVMMRRTLASARRLTQADSLYLNSEFHHATPGDRCELVWLLQTQFDGSMQEALVKVRPLDRVNKLRVGGLIHKYVYEQQQSLQLNLDAMCWLLTWCKGNGHNIETLAGALDHGAFLEAVSILFKAQKTATIDELLAAARPITTQPGNYPILLHTEGYKLAALFGVDRTCLDAFYAETHDLKPIVLQELKRLITHLLSIEYDTSSLGALNKDNWDAMLQCIRLMKATPAQAATQRRPFIQQLEGQGLEFGFAKGGNFRVLREAEEETPDNLGNFPDHQRRVLGFLRAHIVVPTASDAKASLAPIIDFFYQLQIRPTHLNEIEPLLATLEKTPPNQYWSAPFFLSLLESLQPDDKKIPFSISMLKVLLQEDLLAAKPKDDELNPISGEFQEPLAKTLRLILANTIYSREQQAILCQLALREYGWAKVTTLTETIMRDLGTEAYTDLTRRYALVILEKAAHLNDLATRFTNCTWLLQHPSSNRPMLQLSWANTSKHWLKALSQAAVVEQLFVRVKSIADHNKQALILHILAWSTLNPAMRDSEAHTYELDKKSAKLLSRLMDAQILSMDELTALAACYPKQPSPSADDVLRMIKRKTNDGIDWDTVLDTFKRTPNPAPRADFATLAVTRDADLQRMIADTKISEGQNIQHLTAGLTVRLTLVFAH